MGIDTFRIMKIIYIEICRYIEILITFVVDSK
jgi:hypothetical protein